MGEFELVRATGVDVVGMEAEGGQLAIRVKGMACVLTAAQWEAVKEAGDRLLAGERGRKALALAVNAGGQQEEGFRGNVQWIHGGRGPAEELDDAAWANVARVLREMPSGFGDLRWLWDAAGKEGSGGQ